MADKRVYKKDPAISYTHLGEELVLVAVRPDMPSSGEMYTLRGSGIYIWKLIDGRRTVDSIIKGLVKEFDVSDDIAREDVKYILDNLLRHSCIKPVEKKEKVKKPEKKVEPKKPPARTKKSAVKKGEAKKTAVKKTKTRSTKSKEKTTSKRTFKKSESKRKTNTRKS
ncbi:MAG: PqqD family protein [Candidatus Eremiobacteraeota bacterium]|nr:PqqD family protein [Candidatus Eremiobacteraeota bacterium]